MKKLEEWGKAMLEAFHNGRLIITVPNIIAEMSKIIAKYEQENEIERERGKEKIFS